MKLIDQLKSEVYVLVCEQLSLNKKFKSQSSPVLGRILVMVNK